MISNLLDLLLDLLEICDFWKTVIVFDVDLKKREEINRTADFWIEYCTKALEKHPIVFFTE